MKCAKSIKSIIKLYLMRIYGIIKFHGAKIGKNITAQYKLSIKNPQYITVGDECYFGKGCRIEAWDKYNNCMFAPLILFGKDVRINSTCHIGCINHIEIGDQTLIGSHVTIIDHSHGKNEFQELSIHPSERDLYSKGAIIIGKRCWICENVVILPGVQVGDEAIVGANSVVTKSVPPRCVVAGNPARVVRQMDKKC